VRSRRVERNRRGLKVKGKVGGKKESRGDKSG